MREASCSLHTTGEKTPSRQRVGDLGVALSVSLGASNWTSLTAAAWCPYRPPTTYIIDDIIHSFIQLLLVSLTVRPVNERLLEHAAIQCVPAVILQAADHRPHDAGRTHTHT